MLTYAIVGFFAVCLLFVFSPPMRRFLKSVGAYGSAQADRAAESVANQDPLGVYKTQIANAIDSGKNASKLVEKAAQQLEALNRQISDDTKEQARLSSRIQAVLANGDPNKSAQSYALELARVEKNLGDNGARLHDAKETYDENLKMVEKYERDVTTARKDAEDMGFQLEQTKAEKELYQMNSALKDKLNLGDLAQARKRVQDAIDANRGAAKASRDLSHQTIAEEADDELERKQKADDILARFKKPA